MTEKKSIYRIEETDDGLRVVFRRFVNFTRPDKTNDLEREYPDFFVSGFRGSMKEAVRIGTVAHADDAEGWRFRGANTIYYEASVEERELTEAEIEWCEEGFRFSGDDRPDAVFEFEIPRPEDLRSAILDEDLDRYERLQAKVDDPDHRDHVVTTMQDRIEEEKLRAAKLGRDGEAAGLEPEWDPEDSHNDDRTDKHLRDMVSMRSDGMACSFETVFGLSYIDLKMARLRLLDIPEPRFGSTFWSPPAFDLCDHEDWTYCRFCGGVHPEDSFLHVTRRVVQESDDSRYDDEPPKRVCDRCARMHSGEHEIFTEDAVAKAQDERAQRQGDGQRRIGGEYEEVDDGGE